MTGTAVFPEAIPEGRVSALEDHTGLAEALAHDAPGAPEWVVHPESTGEVAGLMTWASAQGVGVLPVCSGRHLSLTCPPPEGRRWIAVSTDRLAGIETYEAADLTLTAGAGTSMSTVDGALRENRQWAPFDPPDVRARSLGGLTACGVSGPLWMGYGELRNHVLGMTVVTGDGRVLRLGGRVVKNVAGFDLLKPMTGSRGSLAVITSVTLRAFPEPAEDRLLAVAGATVDELFAAANAIGTAPVLPVSCVLIDDVADRSTDATSGSSAGGARMLVRLHGARSTVDADQRTLEQHLGSRFEVIEADERRALPGRVSDHAAGTPVSIEASVRPSRLPRLWEALTALEPTETVIDSYAGLVRAGLPGVSPGTVAELTRSVEALGGGVRVARAPVHEVRRGGSRPPTDEAVLTARLREAFDPSGVLWPARS